MLYYDEGDYFKAVEYGTKDMVVNKALFGENHPNYATSLADLALFYSHLGDYSKALECGAKALEIRKVVLGEKHLDYATSLSDLADIYLDLGDYSKALELGENALEIRRDVLGENHSDYAVSLFICSKSYFYLGNYDKAVELTTKAADIEKTVLNRDDLFYAKLLESLAIYNSKLSDYSKALEFEKQAMDITKSVLGEKHPYYANSLSCFANIYYLLGNYSKAIQFEKRALDITKSVLGERHPNYAVSLSNLGQFYFNIRDYSQAIEFEKRALEIRRDVFGENHPDYITSQGNLAYYYSSLGDYSKATEYFIMAIEAGKTAFGESHPEYATLLSNYAGYYADLGDYSKAIELGTKALKISGDVFGENHPDYAASLSNCAIIYSESGNYVKAVEYGNKALEIRRDVLGENHPNYANSLSDLAYYYSDLGDYTKAMEYGTKAAEINMVVYGENSPDYAISVGNLATSYSKLGNHSKAIEYGKKALDILKTHYGENHPFYAKSLKKLSSYYFNYGDYPEASECFKECVSIEKNEILSVFSFLPAFQRSLYWNKYSIDFTDLYPEFLYKSGKFDASDLYNQSALFAKGLLISTITEMNNLILESGDYEALHMFEELRLKKMELQALFEKPIIERYINADSLKSEADQLEKELVERSKIYGDYTKKSQTTWKEIQQSLADDELAIEFLSFNVLGTDSIIVAALTLRNNDTKPKFFPLFELRQLKELSDTVHFICPNLTSLVWYPLQNELQGIMSIFFSPAGVLHNIGIEYAHNMEQYKMFRLSSTREIIDIKTSHNAKKKWSANLYGGINYESSGPMVPVSIMGNNAVTDSLLKHSISQHRAIVDRIDLRGIQIDYLPGSLREVQDIQKSLTEMHHSATVYIGTNATESSVKSLSGKKTDILHLSTHGFYYTESQVKKKEKLHFLYFDDKHHNNYEDKTLMRSGLLMAGAKLTINGRDCPLDTDDGILTAQEISQLNLRDIDFVVLSACETGKGDIMQGEGVFGLQRGFKKAGVKTIVMSLWKVSDFPTEMLMTEFYKNLCNGKSKRESLRLAQKTVREYKDSDGNLLFQDPHYWAGFIMLD